MAWSGTDNHVFGAFLDSVFSNADAFDLDTAGDTIKAALYDNTPVPDEDVAIANTAYAVGQWIVGNEVDDPTDWATGGEPLTGQDITFATGSLKFDAADTPQNGTSCTITDAYGVLVYDSTHASDYGICFLDFNGANSVSAGDFTIQWHTNGIFTAAY